MHVCQGSIWRPVLQHKHLCFIVAHKAGLRVSADKYTEPASVAVLPAAYQLYIDASLMIGLAHPSSCRQDALSTWRSLAPCPVQARGESRAHHKSMRCRSKQKGLREKPSTMHRPQAPSWVRHRQRHLFEHKTQSIAGSEQQARRRESGCGDSGTRHRGSLQITSAARLWRTRHQGCLSSIADVRNIATNVQRAACVY
jgi:hypothetical protein